MLEKPMAALVIWMMALTVSTCITILSAAAEMPELHLAVTAIVSLAIAIVAVQMHRQAMASGATRSALASSTSRYIGLIWIWAGSAILATYEFILQWRESWQFVAGCLFVGCVCLGLAMSFDRDDKAGREDETMLMLGRNLNLLQMVGMLMAVIGLIADNKFVLLATRPLKSDWAANNIFFFGALAVALIGAHALISEKKLAAKYSQAGS
jgi:hypothetical protein